jgi:hypothetical protein
MGIKISALPSADPLSNTDIFPASQGADTNGVTWGDILSAFETAAAGTVVDTGSYTAVPATVSTINFSDTSGFVVGLPIRLVQDSVAKCYVVTAVAANTSITLAGPQLTPAVSVTEIAILTPSRSVQLDFFIPGGYDFQNSTTTLLLRGTRSVFRWQLPKAKMVRASFAHGTPGSGTQPNVNASIAGSAVFTDNTNAGALMSGSANTWVSVGAGTASASNYTVNFGDAIELILNAGANLDARDLSASLVFVLE